MTYRHLQIETFLSSFQPILFISKHHDLREHVYTLNLFVGLKKQNKKLPFKFFASLQG